jgi:hypothetical protein
MTMIISMKINNRNNENNVINNEMKILSGEIMSKKIMKSMA